MTSNKRRSEKLNRKMEILLKKVYEIYIIAEIHISKL